jgi:hypothetical protein
MVLTVAVDNTQNRGVSGLCPSSEILNTVKPRSVTPQYIVFPIHRSVSMVPEQILLMYSLYIGSRIHRSFFQGPRQKLTRATRRNNPEDTILQ